jgi:hypothetical protein
MQLNFYSISFLRLAIGTELVVAMILHSLRIQFVYITFVLFL